MEKKIILRLSNGLGNQMFMYASAYSLAKRLNRKLIIDDETAFRSRKNISKFSLSNFDTANEIAPVSFKFNSNTGYFKRKFLIYLDKFVTKKKFLIEQKNLKKISNYDPTIFTKNYANNLYMEGHFESEKYFINHKEFIKKKFDFRNKNLLKESPFYKILSENNSVSICLRQNRFSEGINKDNDINNIKSKKFLDEQIEYINNSINFFKKRITNPFFFLWSNEIEKIDSNIFSAKIIKINHDKKFNDNLDKNILDLFLITQAKNHIVIPSTFNWWGAWLCANKDKIILRPSSKYFSQFRINNNDFWPDTWLKINK